jgi:hypothetical protein
MNDSQLLCEKAKAGVGFVPIYKLTETVAPRRSKRKRFSSSTNISTNNDNNNNNNNTNTDALHSNMLHNVESLNQIDCSFHFSGSFLRQRLANDGYILLKKYVFF